MRPLAGVRVLDLTRLLPGPFASLVLADLGAQVDKIEDAETGDYTRLGTPQVAGHERGLSRAQPRQTQRWSLDLKNPGGAAVLEAAGASLRRSVRAVSPRRARSARRRPCRPARARIRALIVCALTGYGQTGPLRDRAGHDLNYMARAGLLGMQGPADAPPQLPAFQLADVERRTVVGRRDPGRAARARAHRQGRGARRFHARIGDPVRDRSAQPAVRGRRACRSAAARS